MRTEVCEFPNEIFHRESEGFDLGDKALPTAGCYLGQLLLATTIWCSQRAVVDLRDQYHFEIQGMLHEPCHGHGQGKAFTATKVDCSWSKLSTWTQLGKVQYSSHQLQEAVQV